MQSIFKRKGRENYLKAKKELEVARKIAERAQKDEEIHDLMARYATLKKSRNFLEERFKRTTAILRQLLAQKKRNPKREIKWIFEIQKIDEDINLTESRLSSLEEILKQITSKKQK